MHDEYDSLNYREETFGPLWGAYDMMSGKAQIPMMGFFSLVLVKVSVCVIRETPWLDQRLIDDTRDFKKQ